MVGLIKKQRLFSAMAISATILLILLVTSASVESNKDGASSLNRRMTRRMVEDDATGVRKRVLQSDGEDLSLEFQDPEFIIGGTVLDKNVWQSSRRYLASLANPRTGEPPFHRCTATLISRRVVLTAAHCLSKSDANGKPVFDANGKPVFDANGKEVILNFYSYDDLNGSNRFLLCSIEGGGEGCKLEPDHGSYAKRHEKFTDISNGNDFALIFLSSPAPNDISPVKLNSDIDVPVDGDELEVFGWGLTAVNATVSPKVPNTVNLNYLPNDKCKEKFGGGQFFDSELCAFGNGATSTWKGDSGGPIITLGASGENVQVGVSSFVFTGTGGPPAAPNVFARVSDGLRWITDTICANIPDDEVFCKKVATSSPTTASPSSIPTSSPSSNPTTISPSTATPTNTSPTSNPTVFAGSKSKKQLAAAKSDKSLTKLKSKASK